MKTPLLVGADNAVLEVYDKTGTLVGFTRLTPPPQGHDGGARLAGRLPVPAGGYLVLDDDAPPDAGRRAEQPAIVRTNFGEEVDVAPLRGLDRDQVRGVLQLSSAHVGGGARDLDELADFVCNRIAESR